MSERAQLDSFLNGGSIFGTKVVAWYAAHFSHDPGHEDEDHPGGSHIVGPTLEPER